MRSLSLLMAVRFSRLRIWAHVRKGVGSNPVANSLMVLLLHLLQVRWLCLLSNHKSSLVRHFGQKGLLKMKDSEESWVPDALSKGRNIPVLVWFNVCLQM